MSNETPVSLGECKVLAKSEFGLRVAFLDEGHRAAMWIPHKHIHADSELWETSDKGDRGDLVVNSWWANWKGFL